MCGPSGAGKGTVVTRLVARDPRLWLSRSWTTRRRRPGESPDAYTFVDRATFLQRAESGGFLEWFEVYGDLKGTPTLEPPEGADVVLELDLQGAQAVRERYPEAIIVFVTPPSRAEQERRMRARGDSDADLEARLAKAEAEEELGRALADHVVLNDDAERAAAELATIVERHREQ